MPSRVSRHQECDADASPTDPAAHPRAFTDLLGPLEVVTTADITSALGLWRRHQEIGSFDALLLAVAVHTGAEAVVSEDASLARVGIVPVLTAAEAVQQFVD